MVKLALFSILILSMQASIGQNAYQSQLYLLTKRLNDFEKINLTIRKADKSFLLKKLDLTKDFNRLGEEARMEAINSNLNSELADNIFMTTVSANSRLTFLESYFRYRSELYFTNYQREKVIFLSLFLKVKALE